MIHYGQNLHPLLDSIPEVFYQQEDLYISRQWGISTEEWLGYRRAVSEATVLAELGCNWVNPPFGFATAGDPMVIAPPAPRTDLSDGRWFTGLLVPRTITDRCPRTDSQPDLSSMGTATLCGNSDRWLSQCFAEYRQSQPPAVAQLVPTIHPTVRPIVPTPLNFPVSNLKGCAIRHCGIPN